MGYVNELETKYHLDIDSNCESEVIRHVVLYCTSSPLKAFLQTMISSLSSTMLKRWTKVAIGSIFNNLD